MTIENQCGATEMVSEDNFPPCNEDDYEEEDEEFDDEAFSELFIDVFLVRLVNNEQFIAQAFFDPKWPKMYMFTRIMKVQEIVTPECSQLHFTSFSMLVNYPVLRVEKKHILYMVGINEQAQESYDAFFDEIEAEEARQEAEEKKKTPKVNTNIVSQDKNVVSVNFMKKKDVVIEEESPEPPNTPRAA